MSRSIPGATRLWIVASMGVCGCLVLLGGCRRDAPLVSYEVVKPRRMLAAMLLDRDHQQAWFFKLEGPSTVVTRHAEAFRAFVESVQIDAESGEASWTTPAGWQETEPAPIQVAALAVDQSADPAKVTVTQLGIAADEDADAYLLSNLNRWRGQMGMDRLATLEPTSYEEVTANSNVVALVDLYGRQPDGAEENAADAPRRTPPSMGGGMPQSSLNVEVPEGWEQGPPTGVSAISLAVSDGDQTASVTVTPLNVSPWDANVQRWIGIVAAEPMTAEQIEEKTENVDVGGSPAEWIDLVSAPAVQPARRLIAIRAIRGETAWFIRFDGPPALVERELEKFKTYVKSLPLPE